MRVALDAMGGDSAPASTVRGASMAAQIITDLEVVLVGQGDRIKEELDRLGGSDNGQLSIHEASEIIGMDELPVEALRHKTDSSLSRCVELVKNGEADAVVSAGNTGAFVAAALFALKPLERVKRPGIAITFRVPNAKGLCTVIDVGANIKCRPSHLLQYSVMASVYNCLIHGVREPAVGLLSIGEEDEKGNELVKEARALLYRAPINFSGNVEGRDIFIGHSDVVVCDGFVGNVILKVSEGLSEAMLQLLTKEAGRDIRSRIGFALCKPAIKRIKDQNDFAEYGGAPLLGVDGVCIVGHGRSDAKAVKNAIRVATKFTKNQVNSRIVSDIASLKVDGPNS